MTLPKLYAPMETVEVAGESFTLRVITRAEQFRLQRIIKDGAPEDEQEIAAIAMATDTAPEEVREWYAATPAWAVRELIDHIERVSRLGGEAEKSGG